MFPLKNNGRNNECGREETTPWQAVDTTWEFREERLYSSDSATMMNRFDVIKLLNYLSDGSVISISLWFRLWHLRKPHYKNLVGAYFHCKQSILKGYHLLTQSCRLNSVSVNLIGSNLWCCKVNFITFFTILKKKCITDLAFTNFNIFYVFPVNLVHIPFFYMLIN